MSSIAEAPHIAYVGNWPDLSSTQLAAIVGINVGALFLAWFMLRIVWKVPTDKELRSERG